MAGNTDKHTTAKHKHTPTTHTHALNKENKVQRDAQKNENNVFFILRRCVCEMKCSRSNNCGGTEVCNESRAHKESIDG